LNSVANTKMFKFRFPLPCGVIQGDNFFLIKEDTLRWDIEERLSVGDKNKVQVLKFKN
jgi:hypothetical protein